MVAPRRVLVVAATDSSGGAGLTRDLQALTDWRTEGCCAVTAVTVQTHRGLLSMQALSAASVVAQMRAAMTDTVQAIKIGMLASADIVRALARELEPSARAGLPIVLDPVLAATSGAVLLESEGVACLRRELLPRVSLLTPNLPEAAALLQQPLAQDEPGMLEQMRALQALGAGAVLLKGGHVPATPDGQVTDRLLTADGAVVYLRTLRARGERRGTGCSLASAIAAQLAAGIALETACRAAQGYVAAALQGRQWQGPPLEPGVTP